MPFNGTGSYTQQIRWTHKKIIAHIEQYVPRLIKLPDPPFSTSYNYQVEGYQGTLGVIAAYSRTFCGTCNRIRITAQGHLKTCLYDEGVLDIKSMLRTNLDDEAIKEKLLHAFQHRAKDGFEAEQRNLKPIHESMSAIGG